MSAGAGPDLDTLRAALVAVGRLTAAQAALLCSSSPQAAGIRLRQLVDEGEAVAFGGAYWHPRCPRRGFRHREAVAEMYVRLSPLAPAWRFEVADPNAAYRPDAWLVSDRAEDRRQVALEADRGTERRKAWGDKLARFVDHGGGRMVVAVPDSSRTRRVGAWAEEAGVSALVLPAAALTAEVVLGFIEEIGPAPTRTENKTESRAGPPERGRTYTLNGVLVSAAQFFAKVDKGASVVGVERLAGGDVWHAATPSRKRTRILSPRRSTRIR